MSLTWRDGIATAVTGALAAGWVGLAQQATWAPVTSVRWYAVLFLVVGQTTCAVCAADLARQGVLRSPGFFLGPLALVSSALAVVTGSVAVLGVAVVATAGLWALSTGRHVLGAHAHLPWHHLPSKHGASA